MRKNSMKLITVLVVIMMQILPMNVFAEKDQQPLIEPIKVLLLADQNEEEIVLYEDEYGIHILTSIQDNTMVDLLDPLDQHPKYSYIRYIQESISMEGYVDKDRIVHLEDDVGVKKDSQKELDEEGQQAEFEAEFNTNEKPDSNNKEKKLDDSHDESNDERKTIHITQFKQNDLFGVALKKRVSVYEKTNQYSKILKAYNYGTLLKYKPFNDEWYEATVYLNGKPHTGYIYHKDVGPPTTSLQGYARTNPTVVYSNTSKKSSKLKSYQLGSLLKFKVLDKSWYEARVFVNGEIHTGYIHKKDVSHDAPTLNGYAHKDATPVYEKKTKASKKLKTYPLGSKLIYKAHDRTWYQATVYVKGKRHTGYIHKNDVGSKLPILEGYAQHSPTNVYANTSKKSNNLKSYEVGSRLKYSPYNKTWYQATIYVKGKKHTGYIHKNDVGKNLPSLTGYALNNSVYVYEGKSKNAKKLKGYKKGARLKYYPHNKTWYQATVYVRGKKLTGFIHKNDVGSPTKISFVDPSKTYTYNRMVSDIKALANAYPDLISYQVVGKSEYGRDIYAVSLGKGDATTFINGSIHAREWISSTLNMYMLENYAKSYRNNRKIKGYNVRNVLNDTTIWFMPMVNPDGVTLQQKGLKAFPKIDHTRLIRMNNGSKNFKRWKANAKGVDINRNFSVNWNYVKNNVNKPNYQNHKGTKPLSSSEARAVANFVKKIKPEMSINYHTSGRVIYWGYKQSGSRYIRAHNHAKNISRMTGYIVLYPGKNPSGGGFLQWFTEIRKRPSITPELAPYAGQTNPPVSRFAQIWQENQAVGLYAARESAKLFRK